MNNDFTERILAIALAMIGAITIGVFQGKDRALTIGDLRYIGESHAEVFKVLTGKNPLLKFDRDELAACRKHLGVATSVRVGREYFQIQDQVLRTSILFHEFMHYANNCNDHGYIHGIEAQYQSPGFCPSNLVISSRRNASKQIDLSTLYRLDNADHHFAWYFLLCK